MSQPINSKFIFLCSPRHLKIKYRNSKGVEKDYKCVPIEYVEGGFVSYVFGAGVRRFKNEGIIELAEAD